MIKPLPVESFYLQSIAAQQARLLTEQLERDGNILNIRAMTGWDERQVIDAAQRLNLSLPDLRALCSALLHDPKPLSELLAALIEG